MSSWALKGLVHVALSLSAVSVDFYQETRLPVTRWVKLSLNFELQVKRVMKFLLGQRLFNNNIFVQLELFRIQEATKKIK